MEVELKVIRLQEVVLRCRHQKAFCTRKCFYLICFAVIDFGIQLVIVSRCSGWQRGQKKHGFLLDRVHLLDAIKPQEAETSNGKMSMEHINYISRPVPEPAILRVLVSVSGMHVLEKYHTDLTTQDEGGELAPIDPVESIDHRQARPNPPAVTCIGKLLRTPVEAPFLHLPLTEPAT